MPSIVYYEKHVFPLVFLDKAEDLVVELAMGILSRYEKLLCRKAILLSESIMQIVQLPFNLELVLFPPNQENFNLLISRIGRVGKGSLCRLTGISKLSDSARESRYVLFEGLPQNARGASCDGLT